MNRTGVPGGAANGIMPDDPKILALYLAHRGELVSYANKLIGDMAYAEDAVQEAYLRFEKASGDRVLEEPLAYLYRIVRNLSFDQSHRAGVERGRQIDNSAAVLPHLRDCRPSPENEAEARQELMALSLAMADLPEANRKALELHRFDGLTVRQIAERMGISVGSAHALVVNALDHCRERMFRR